MSFIDTAEKKDCFNVGDKVMVSATATGFGRDIPGVIDEIEEFMGYLYISISFLQPCSWRRGITINNPGLITKLKNK